MCVNNLSKVALDSAAAGIEPATSSRKSNALTATPPSHTTYGWWLATLGSANNNIKHHIGLANPFQRFMSRK